MSPTINGRTRLVGLIGDPVEHTLSPIMHGAAFDALGLNFCYVPLPVKAGQTEDAVRGLAALGFVGVNVTFPHKQAVMPLLDTLSAEARAIGAVNTLVFREGKKTGYNMDGIGFLAALTARGIEVNGLPALILGAGGAARAVAYTLARSGASVTILNRTREKAEELVRSLHQHLEGAQMDSAPFTPDVIADLAPKVGLIVNATTVGMAPHEDASPWPADLPFPSGCIAYDLIYAPLETKFLAQAKASGAQTLNGLDMLVYQGAQGFKLWTGHEAPIEVMFDALRDWRTGH